MKLVRRPGVCEWLGARHLRSGVRATLVDRGDKFKLESVKRLNSLRGVGSVGTGPSCWTYLGGVASRLEPVQKVELTSTWIRGDRQVFDHHGKNIAVSIALRIFLSMLTRYNTCTK